MEQLTSPGHLLLDSGEIGSRQKMQSSSDLELRREFRQGSGSYPRVIQVTQSRPAGVSFCDIRGDGHGGPAKLRSQLEAFRCW
jgi:hypothetical protein